MGRLIAIAFLLTAAVAAAPFLDRLTDPAQRTERETGQGYAPRSVSLAADGSGHFLVETSVNGWRIAMMADTGASAVVLTHEDARRIGVHPGESDYSLKASTANGIAEFAPIRLDRIEVDGIVVRDVQAAVARPGALRTSLLGMTFIGELSGFRLERDQLILVE